jgi:Domain of unknown function (DUF4404)
MVDNKSRELLQQLHDEINGIQKVDDKGIDLLKDIDGDIRELLERSGETQMEVHPTVLQRLDNAIDHFEVTHPELTALISKVFDSLSNVGV